jgi:hypothetical protein
MEFARDSSQLGGMTSTDGGMMEIGSYAELINKQILIPEQPAGYIRVEAHFFVDCILRILQKINVDEAWYIQAYPDVRDAIQKGIVPDAKSHYYRFGYFEHRMPYQIVVDEPWYQAQYPDVRAAIVGRHFASGQAHFDLLGFREGRFPYANFRLDLVDGFRLNGRAQPIGRARSLPGARDKIIHIESAIP